MSTNSYDTPDSPQQHSNKSLSAHRDVKSTDSRLDQLRVEESTLIKGLRYEDLNLYEKKSILVSFCSSSIPDLAFDGSSSSRLLLVFPDQQGV